MGGYRHLPDEGGLNGQATWVMAAFDVIAAAVKALKPE